MRVRNSNSLKRVFNASSSRVREHEVVPGDFDGHVEDDGGEFLGEQRLVGVGLDVFLLLAFELRGIGDEILDGAELGDEFFRGLLADAGDAGDVVGGVAPQAEDVDDLLRALDLPVREHGRQVDDLHGRSPCGRVSTCRWFPK